MPGAAGLIAVNHLVRATPDGLTLGLIDGRPAVETLIAEAPSVDVRNLPIVGSPGGDGVVCAFSRASGFTLDVWRSGRVPRIGLTGRGSSGAAYSLLVSEALSLPIRPVFGYSGTSDIRAAIASGEVDGLCMNRASLVASFQPLDAYVVAIQLGVGGDASLAGVPAADSMVASARGASLLSVAAAIGRLARCLVLPPNTPDERVRALRNAFERTVRDPAFLEAARKSRLDVQPESADDLNKAIADLLSLPPGLRREIGRLLSGAGTS
jgi:tripartite-type tricarboxylate transporter receptor subunit TctC